MLSYNKAWDTRPVRYGAHQGPRDHSVGELVPAEPGAITSDVEETLSIRFVSGHVMQVAPGQQWVTQRRRGRQAWEWKRSDALVAGDRIPLSLTAGRFGRQGTSDEGYFVGAMLGDGGMTSCTPEFHGDPGDGAVSFMRAFAAKHGCEVREIPQGSIVRLRFPYLSGPRNPLTQFLRRFGVWGQSCAEKHLPDEPFSRSFWVGCVSGLVDTDGHVRERRNPKGTVHGSVEYATVSPLLARQVADALLRFGVTSRHRVVERRSEEAHWVNGYRIKARRPLNVLEVSRATALVRLADLLRLRIGYKATSLEGIAHAVGHVEPARSDMHGYDESVALDRVASIEPAGRKRVFSFAVGPASLFIVNGLVTGAS
ncbi:LAGLIDADG family homing endonuclease [Streptomyces tendae]|uniref:LAGLIDADG family homing endonuclease n=1 Tax=Streptomyces tendae TaxID=1932 RepID=UPI00369814D7